MTPQTPWPVMARAPMPGLRGRSFAPAARLANRTYERDRMIESVIKNKPLLALVALVYIQSFPLIQLILGFLGKSIGETALDSIEILFAAALGTLAILFIKHAIGRGYVDMRPIRSKKTFWFFTVVALLIQISFALIVSNKLSVLHDFIAHVANSIITMSAFAIILIGSSKHVYCKLLAISTATILAQFLLRLLGNMARGGMDFATSFLSTIDYVIILSLSVSLAMVSYAIYKNAVCNATALLCAGFSAVNIGIGLLVNITSLDDMLWAYIAMVAAQLLAFFLLKRKPSAKVAPATDL